MKRTVIVDFHQRAAPGGVTNCAEVHTRGLRTAADGTRALEFQHVGVESLPEPRVLDGYMFGVLFLAMKEGAERLEIRGPVSLKALRNAQHFGEAWRCWLPNDYRPIEIYTESIIEGNPDQLPAVGRETRNASACAAAFSGGADSTFSILRHATGDFGHASFRVRDLVMVHGFDVDLANEEHFAELVERTGDFVDSVGAELHVVKTNIKDASHQDWEHSFGAQLACVLHQFSDKFRYGMLGSSAPYSHPISAWGSTSGTDFLLSGDFFEIVHDGAGFPRTEKIEAIARDPVARRCLKVCWEGKNQGRNCGVCEKCVRTQLNFLAVGVQEPECFEAPLDMNHLRTLTCKNTAQLTNLIAIAEYADSRGVEAEWLELLREKIAEINTSLRQEDSEATSGRGAG